MRSSQLLKWRKSIAARPGRAKLPYTARVIDLNTLPLPALFAELTKDGSLGRLLAACRAEDLGHDGDVTTASSVPAETRAKATLVAREAGVIAGLAVIGDVLGAFGAHLNWNLHVEDGSACAAGATLATFEGSLAGLLSAERTMLNIIARLCGTATLTRRFVDAIAGTKARICDTRKTSPAMRSLQKYAVRCGGGWMHRIGLYDAALFKDNHLAHVPVNELAAWVERVARGARSRAELRFVEVEVTTLEQLREVLRVPAGLVEMVLLDNMSLEHMREAVALRDAHAPGVLLEASGGVKLDTVRAIAETGVDRISVGALTHTAPAMDLALEVTP